LPKKSVRMFPDIEMDWHFHSRFAANACSIAFNGVESHVLDAVHHNLEASYAFDFSPSEKQGRAFWCAPQDF